MSPTSAQAEIGVFGGSGFYSFLDDAVEVTLDTPYGSPTAPVTIGDVAGRRVAFLPRHGRRHELPPHCINYRANLWAMREVGVTRLIGPCAAGSLQPQVAPGDFVVPDQLVDRTRSLLLASLPSLSSSPACSCAAAAPPFIAGPARDPG